MTYTGWVEVPTLAISTLPVVPKITGLGKLVRSIASSNSSLIIGYETVTFHCKPAVQS
ncbi:MAG: hypothetical protein ACXACB_01250 [Promethearchaeota archaeon]